MFITQLEQLRDRFDTTTLGKFDRYLAGLSPAAQELISGMKLSLATQTLLDKCDAFLEVCADRGIMQQRYGIYCPIAGNLLGIQDSPELEPSDEKKWYCLQCEEYHSANDLISGIGTVGQVVYKHPIFRLLAGVK